MKRRTIYNLSLFLFVIQFTAFGQKGKLIFDFSFSQQYWKMNMLNNYLVDLNNPFVDLFIEGPYLKDGFKYQGQLNYQYSKHFNFGVYANYQTAQTTFEKNFMVYDAIEDVYTEYVYDFILKPESKSVGLNLGILYHEFFNFDTKSKFLKRLSMSNDLKCGIAHSKLNGYQVLKKPYKNTGILLNGTSTHLTGDISLAITYRLIDKQVFSAIGIHVGYQFLASGIIRNRSEQTLALTNGTSANLDFSGLYFGINLSYGK